MSTVACQSTAKPKHMAKYRTNMFYVLVVTKSLHQTQCKQPQTLVLHREPIFKPPQIINHNYQKIIATPPTRVIQQLSLRINICTFLDLEMKASIHQ